MKRKIIDNTKQRQERKGEKITNGQKTCIYTTDISGTNTHRNPNLKMDFQ